MRNQKCCGWISIIAALIAGIAVFALLAGNLLAVITAVPFFIILFATGVLTLLQMFTVLPIDRPSICGCCGRLRLAGCIGTVVLLIPGLLLPITFTAARNFLVGADVFFLVLLIESWICQYQNSCPSCNCKAEE